MTKNELKSYHEKFFWDVFSLVFSLTGDRQVSQDITKDAFLDLYKMGDGLTEDRNVKCFLLMSARNYTLDYLKKLQHA
jgi:RNA polymerase sigma-70 factor (ECF subfamily)